MQVHVTNRTLERYKFVLLSVALSIECPKFSNSDFKLLFVVKGKLCRLLKIVAKPLFQHPVKFRNFHLWGIGDRLSDMDIELRPGGESRMHIDGNWHSIYQGRIASLQDPRQPFFKGEILAGEGTDFPFRIEVESPLFPF